MGLCKCPKRRVTNQFCFEHRVNVCEHCMVTNHPKCIVQSYLQWLQDSDYNPICELCTKELATEDCVRLICYHVYHWACLDQFARQLPPTTAPAGYMCPSCKVGLFPASNLVSPVADVLREKLAGVNWARTGLGLPLLNEDHEQKPSGESRKLVTDDVSPMVSNHVEELGPSAVPHSDVSNQRQSTPKRTVAQSNPVPSSNVMDGNPHSVVHMEDAVSAFSRTESFPVSGQLPRRVFEALDDPKDVSFDHDENKYKRRSATEWFSRWWKSVSGPSLHSRKIGGHMYRRYWMATVLLVVGLLTLIVIFSWLGRMSTADDPSFDPLYNPNIRIAKQKE
ncbi:Zinc finger protein-like 1 [Cryptotermes secundus]|uniref:Zinc finger protein-like 1 homolog n=1 Tax=Cryptotermes secundus TaxID=105785 RepID=A0A2J7R9Z6_9NEOP|nr:zinc finger protein-like 1 [Cryptotermes secundus]XP_023703617.1 zinc finger protein-like 1 [Cryptotermes secundus]PNF37651.1 Zinc finger protein-like 1 [Cryptotermes secundus]